MQRSNSQIRPSSHRRLFLLPEEAGTHSGEGPRIRRYQLASIGRRSGPDGIEAVSAQLAGELSRLARMPR